MRVIPLTSDSILTVLASPNLEFCLLAFVLPNENGVSAFFYQNHHFDLRVAPFFSLVKPNPNDGFSVSFASLPKPEEFCLLAFVLPNENGVSAFFLPKPSF